MAMLIRATKRFFGRCKRICSAVEFSAFGL
jgi:hypothetical protein